MADGRRVDDPVTGDGEADDLTLDSATSTRNGVLYILALALACGAVFGSVLVYRTHDERQRASAEQEVYGDVLAAATTEAEAFVNIRYDDAQASLDRVAAGATGDFRTQYDSSAKGVLRALKKNRSVFDGSVIWAGISSLEPDRATVIAATTGTVANRETNNLPVARNYRLRLELVLVDGEWLTNDLEFVG